MTWGYEMKLSFELNKTGKDLLLELLKDPDIQDEIVSIIEGCSDLNIDADIDEEKINEIATDAIEEVLKTGSFSISYDG